MLIKLKGTEHEKSAFFASAYAALVDGVSPALAAMLCVFPYFLGLVGVLSGEIIFYLSIAIGGIILFSLGFYLGKLSRDNEFILGLRMLFIGLIVGLLSIMLDFVIK